VFVVAYDAAGTIISAIERIPKRTMEEIDEVYVFDDCSSDGTHKVAAGYKSSKKLEKLNVYRNEKKLGYGGNQKRGYDYAISKGYDIAVMLHGDVQYAPEKIPELVEPLLKGKADMVFGSRMSAGVLNAFRCGMPIWKIIGNRILTAVENFAFNWNLSEYHSGFRAYNLNSLKKLPFRELTDDYHFDTEIFILLKENNMKVEEIPIDAHYGPESLQITFKKSVSYGWNILKLMAKYALYKRGLKKFGEFPLGNQQRGEK